MKIEATPATFTETQREIITQSGKKFAEYAKGIDANVVFLDTAVTLGADAFWAYWQQAYPQEQYPDTYFMNPSGLYTRVDTVDQIKRVHQKYVGQESSSTLLDQLDAGINPQACDIFDILSPALRWDDHYPDINPQQAAAYVYKNTSPLQMKLAEFDTEDARMPLYAPLATFLQSNGFKSNTVDTSFLDRSAVWLAAANKYADRLKNPRTEQEILDEMRTHYGALLTDPDKPVLLVDICRDTRKTTQVVANRLRTLGIRDIHIGIVNENEGNDVVDPVNMYVAKPVPRDAKNVFRTTLVCGQSSSVVSVPWAETTFAGTATERETLASRQLEDKSRRKGIHALFTH